MAKVPSKSNQILELWRFLVASPAALIVACKLVGSLTLKFDFVFKHILPKTQPSNTVWPSREDGTNQGGKGRSYHWGLGLFFYYAGVFVFASLNFNPISDFRWPLLFYFSQLASLHEYIALACGKKTLRSFYLNKNKKSIRLQQIIIFYI